MASVLQCCARFLTMAFQHEQFGKIVERNHGKMDIFVLPGSPDSLEQCAARAFTQVSGGNEGRSQDSIG